MLKCKICGRTIDEAIKQYGSWSLSSDEPFVCEGCKEIQDSNELHRYSSDETEYVLLQKNDPLITELIIQKNCLNKKRSKIDFASVLELFDRYGIRDLKDLQQVLYFACYYKTENLELRDKIANMKSPQVKYVIVENSKTGRRTIFKKLNTLVNLQRLKKHKQY